MRKLIVAALALSLTVPVVATADEIMDAVKARQEHMKGYGKAMDALGKMAKGEIDYDAAGAQAAADSIVKLSKTDISPFFLPGSSSEDLPDNSRALPALWTEEGKKAGEIGGQLVAAAAALQSVAGSGKGEMAGALGGVGKNCQACHKSFQAEKKD